jgi:4'-phosphopantetheinyl transferase EntD
MIERVAGVLAAVEKGALFDAPIHVLAGRISTTRHSLFPEEIYAIANAVPQRVAEFTAGRSLARQAIRMAGGECAAIPMRSDRSPVWPTGWAGSISHSGDVCVAAAASTEFVRSVGLDVELNDIADERMLRYVCAPDELLRAQAAVADRDLAPRLLFSAKEAFFKAYYPLYGRFIDFLDIRVSLAPAGTFSVEPVSSTLFDEARHAFAGRWTSGGGAVLTGVACRRR